MKKWMEGVLANYNFIVYVFKILEKKKRKAQSHFRPSLRLRAAQPPRHSFTIGTDQPGDWNHNRYQPTRQSVQNQPNGHLLFWMLFSKGDQPVL
jgi:hypothetical protein